MLSSLLIKMLPLIKLVGEEFEKNIPEFKTKIKTLIEKHRKQMASDPNYPTMLIFLASILVKKYVRKQSQAAMAIFLFEQAIRQVVNRLDWDRRDYWDDDDGYSNY